MAERAGVSDVATRVINIQSEDETGAFGRRLGEAAQPGDLIALTGDLGAGKTTLVKAIAEGLGIACGRVSSPTFALLAEHPHGRVPLYHLDVYRLTDPAQLYDLGFDDYLRRADGLIVIEWAERVATELPDERLGIIIDLGGGEHDRQFHLAARGARALELMKAVC